MNMEHSGTFRNIPGHRIIMRIMRKTCKIQFSKTKKTCNLDAAKLSHILLKFKEPKEPIQF